MKKVTFLLLVVLVATASCKKDKPFPFAGSWSGSYSGGDQGMWRVRVNSDGTLTGSGSSTRTGQEFSLDGNVSDNGGFRATSGVTGTGSEFTGTLTVEGDASGTWKNKATNSTLEGTWVGERE